MGHQPRAAMEAAAARVDAAAGPPRQLIGEGWNFGEVADGARFVQASQLSLDGTGIGTFSDRARDALRGGGAGDSGAALVARAGLAQRPALRAQCASRRKRSRSRPAARRRPGARRPGRHACATTAARPPTARTGALSAIDYKGQPAGYASAARRSRQLRREPRQPDPVRHQRLQAAARHHAARIARACSCSARRSIAFSQGVAYFHAGIDMLRSKSLDRNSFDSGDWFNRLDWSYQDNYFGTGLPPRTDNGKDWDADAAAAGRRRRSSRRPRDIAFMRDGFRDLLRIRASSPLFRLRSAQDIRAAPGLPRCRPGAEPGGGRGASRRRGPGRCEVPRGALPHQCRYRARSRHHCRHRRESPTCCILCSRDGVDARARQARFDPRDGRFTVPARTAVVFVVE